MDELRRIDPRPALRPGDELELRIDSLAYGGEGVGRIGGFVIFVEGTAPGDQVRARIRRAYRRHAEATLVSVLSPGPHRITPRCPHFQNDACGGCAWQQLDYEGQLAAKEAIVRDSLERLGGFSDLPLRPILGAPSPWHFRNKMEFAFQPQGTLGLHPRGAWDRIFRLETCFLPPPLAVKIVETAREFALARGLSLHDPRTKQGFLRELMVRHTVNTGQTMIGLITSPGPFPDGEEFAAALAALDPSIIGVVRGIRSGVSDGSPLEEVSPLHGQPFITETLAGLSFQIGLPTFFQTNTAQAERLVALAQELAGPAAGGFAIDLYCGVGVFTLALAQKAHHVAGIEMVAASIEAARENAARNGVANVSFVCGEARTALPEVLAQHGPPRLLLLDPPRGGAGGKVMRRIARSQPERIIYVSCNPTTLARDLRELIPFGYRIAQVQPVDLFPQTYHVETIVALDRGEPPAPVPEAADLA